MAIDRFNFQFEWHLLYSLPVHVLLSYLTILFDAVTYKAKTY